ncbi:PREDICTED: tripartite motif-containing protein 42 [Pterocles gutturalis]|uniref:tripartite motif-containing protein 42 n=1 Tax=Pterocles gutturalis TaxID=240206 RepID=UPI000528FA1A|nr:PREDICTED: tripartite motif-containing protein 42 [Pterocles gutturalis]
MSSREPTEGKKNESKAEGQKMSRFRTRNNASVITPERNVSSHPFHDLLACPLCNQLFLQPFMLPCNHCICERCITKSKTKAEVTENFYIIVCPVCSKAHCLPYTNKIQLRNNYLRAKPAKNYMRRHGFLRWRFDHSERPVYCEACTDRRVATKRCRTCGINYCNECLHLNHSKSGAQDHIFTKAHQEDHEQWHCLLHRNTDLSEYCLDDHELICGFCKNSLHNDHETVPLAATCSREAASLFDTIAKFRKVRQGVDNDLMEVILLKNNFKTYKDTKRKEIRNGFLKLRMVLHEQEEEMVELLENIELKKQKEISEYINYTSCQLSYMDGLIQYSKEALKEESQLVFLQLAHCLVKEIENAVPSIFQPSPCLRDDPLRKLQLNFDELFSILQGLVPSLSGIKQSESEAENYPSSLNPDIMVPRRVSSTHKSKQATLFQSSSLFDLGVLPKDAVRRPHSTPPHHSTQSNEACAYQDTVCETPRKERKHHIVKFSSPEPTDNESVPVPGPVVIYQTAVYSKCAKIYWTCPTEDVAFFEVEFYEVAGIGPDNIVQTQLASQLSNIQQQNLETGNLDPNTEYLFKVRAVNASGQGEWSEICKIITSDEYGNIKDRREKQKSIQGAVHEPSR